MKPQSPTRCRCVFTSMFATGMLLGFAAGTHAQTNASWAVDAAGNWGTSGNWSPTVVPGGVGSVVGLNNNITDHRTVTIDTDDRTVGVLSIGDTNGSHRFTLAASGGASLILDNDDDPAEINFLSTGAAGNNITAPVILASSANIANATNTTQNFTGVVLSTSGSGTKTLANTSTGNGTVELNLSSASTLSNVRLEQKSSTSLLHLRDPGSDVVTFTFGGGVEIAGTLDLRFNIGLGSSNIDFKNGAVLRRPGTSGGQFLSGTNTLEGTVTFGPVTPTAGDWGQMTFSGPATLLADVELRVNNIQTRFLNTSISGDYGITRTGDTTLLFDGTNNSFNGFIQNSGTTIAANHANALGAGTLTLNGGTLALQNFTGGLNFGRNTTVGGDVTLQSSRSVTGAGVTHTLGTLEIGSHTLTMGVAGNPNSGSQGIAFGATTITGNATFNILNGALATGHLNLGALNGSGSIAKTGAGILRLTAAAGSYSGTTTVNAGTLDIANASGLGSTALVIGGGTVLAPAGAALSNTSITLAGGAYQKSYSSAEAYTNYKTALSDLGGSDTAASFLAGAAGGTRTVSTSFALNPSAAVANDSQRISDVFNLGGTSTDIFVLQLNVAGVSASSLLAWNDSGTWVNAIEGNSATGGSATFFPGSFADSGTSATAAYLGSWGVDVGSGNVWAILDHNSEFAVIPEPSAWLLAGFGLALVLLRRKSARFAAIGAERNSRPPRRQESTRRD